MVILGVCWKTRETMARNLLMCRLKMLTIIWPMVTSITQSEHQNTTSPPHSQSYFCNFKIFLFAGTASSETDSPFLSVQILVVIDTFMVKNWSGSVVTTLSCGLLLSKNGSTDTSMHAVTYQTAYEMLLRKRPLCGSVYPSYLGWES